jgi:hypothetical protein
LVPPPPAGLAGVRRGEEPDLWVEFSIKVVSSQDWIRGFVANFFLASTSMEMASSTISDLRPFVRRRDLLLGVNDGVVRLQFYRYGLSDLTSPSRFWSFSHGCREEDYPRNICPGCYVLDNDDSYTRLSSDVD